MVYKTKRAEDLASLYSSVKPKFYYVDFHRNFPVEKVERKYYDMSQNRRNGVWFLTEHVRTFKTSFFCNVCCCYCC